MTGSETLKAFFEKHPGAMRAKLAEALGVSRTVVYYWQEGRVVPSPQRRKDIAAFSRGEVPEECWGPSETESTVKPFDADPPAEPGPDPVASPDSPASNEPHGSAA